MSTRQTASRRPALVARWELVTDDRGRTRPQMRWEVAAAPATPSPVPAVTLAA
jgi:hypothetical protein